MANSIKNDPGSKRYAGQEERAVRQKLDSKKNTYLERLPYEIKKMVAEHFQRDDLERLAKISPDWKAAALDAFNTQCMQEEVKKLKAYGIWNQEEVYVESHLDFYRSLVAAIQKPIYLNKHPGLQITPEKLVDLQKRQAELFTRQAETELLELKAACYKDLDKGEATFEGIEEKHRRKEIDFVAQGLNNLILATSNPKSTRSWTVGFLSAYGFLELVQAVLSNGKIYDDTRGIAVRGASYRGYVHIVKELLASGKITKKSRSMAVHEAVVKGHIEIVQILLANGAISKNKRQLSIKQALKHQRNDIVDVLRRDQG